MADVNVSIKDQVTSNQVSDDQVVVTQTPNQAQQIPSTIAPNSSNVRLFVNQEICIQCQTCVMMYPTYFELKSDNTVHEIGDGVVPADKVDEIMSVCPSSAINKKL